MVTWQSWHFADDGEGHDWPEHFFFFFHEFRIKNARDTSKRQSNGVMKQAQETGMNDAARRVRDRKQRGREGAHTQKRVCEIEGRRKKKSHQEQEKSVGQGLTPGWRPWNRGG